MDDNISLLKTIEKTYTNNEVIEILVYKKMKSILYLKRLLNLWMILLAKEMN